MQTPPPGSFWDTIRSWADSAGLLLPPEEREQPQSRHTVPESVCANCPICQGAATLDQVNPQVLADLADVARSLLAGMGSALDSAAEQRCREDSKEGPPSPEELDDDTSW